MITIIDYPLFKAAVIFGLVFLGFYILLAFYWFIRSCFENNSNAGYLDDESSTQNMSATRPVGHIALGGDYYQHGVGAGHQGINNVEFI